MKLLGGLLKALLPLIVVLIVAEVGLSVAGIDPPPLGDAGLTGARLIVPDPEQPGGWRTQFFNGWRPEQQIAPRDGRRRVLLMGGSNTAYFPESVLDYVLDDEGRRDDWEILNLGREGYGSQRVLRVLRDAMALRPDVVVLYVGHNEFVERSFEAAVEQQRGGLGALLLTTFGTLRSARLLGQALRPARAPDSAGLASSELARGTGEDESLSFVASLGFEDTLAYREAYAANLAAMVDVAEAGGARVLICTVVRNMLVPPRIHRPPEGLGRDALQRLTQVRRDALAAIPLRFREHLRPYDSLWVRSWYAGHDPALGLVPAPQRPLLGAAADAPALDGSKSASVEGAHWPDPAGWAPETFAMLDTASQVLVRRDPSEVERQDLERARALLDEGLSMVPGDALLQYDRGLVGLLLGEPDAVARIDASLDADLGPRTTCPAQNALVRALAVERDLPLVDAARLFRERSPEGLVAFELMLDHSHLNPGARVLFMVDLAGAIRALGL